MLFGLQLIHSILFKLVLFSCLKFFTVFLSQPVYSGEVIICSCIHYLPAVHQTGCVPEPCVTMSTQTGRGFQWQAATGVILVFNARQQQIKTGFQWQAAATTHHDH